MSWRVAFVLNIIKPKFSHVFIDFITPISRRLSLSLSLCRMTKCKTFFSLFVWSLCALWPHGRNKNAKRDKTKIKLKILEEDESNVNIGDFYRNFLFMINNRAWCFNACFIAILYRMCVCNRKERILRASSSHHKLILLIRQFMGFLLLLQSWALPLQFGQALYPSHPKWSY